MINQFGIANRLRLISAPTARLAAKLFYKLISFREEMEDVVGSVFDLVGRTSDPILEEEVINERVNRIFQVNVFYS